MRLISALLGAALLALGLCSFAHGDGLAVGDRAPDWTLPGSDGQTHSLNALRGRHVVLAWFPKAFTGG